MQLTLQQHRLAFEAQAADAASYLHGAADACLCPMLLLFWTLTFLDSQVMSLALCAFNMHLASIKGFGWAEQLLAQLAL